MSKEREAIRSTYLSIAGNCVLVVVKGLTGILGNSYALIADAIESTADVCSSTLLLIGIRYSLKPADKNHPYGHGRAEPLVTFTVVGFLVVAAVIIGWESIRNIRTPHDLPKPYTLIVLGFIILVKEIFYRIVKRKGEITNSSSLKADAWHHRSDAITSLTAFIGISIALILGKGYENADDWAALVACVIILYNSYLIFRPALGEIMDEQLYDPLINEIRELSKQVEGVIDTEKCFIRKAGMQYLVDLHLVVKADISVKEGHFIAHNLKDHLQEKLPHLADVFIHVEPDE
jgi:cation diffusion facilitator family transporter